MDTAAGRDCLRGRRGSTSGDGRRGIPSQRPGGRLRVHVRCRGRFPEVLAREGPSRETGTRSRHCGAETVETPGHGRSASAGHGWPCRGRSETPGDRRPGTGRRPGVSTTDRLSAGCRRPTPDTAVRDVGGVWPRRRDGGPTTPWTRRRGSGRPASGRVDTLSGEWDFSGSGGVGLTWKTYATHLSVRDSTRLVDDKLPKSSPSLSPAACLPRLP